MRATVARLVWCQLSNLKLCWKCKVSFKKLKIANLEFFELYFSVIMVLVMFFVKL